MRGAPDRLDGMDGRDTDDFGTAGTRENTVGEARGSRGLARFARPALIAGSVIAVVCVALLVIIFLLDSFNATVYSVGGKDVKDATEEARAIRDTYAAARVGGIIALILGVLAALAGGFVLYRERNASARIEEDDDGQDWDYEDLAGE
jgi:ABC-type Fe3+ transport system permease subunit